MSMLFVRGMLVKRDFISKLALTKLGSYSPPSSAKENESFIVYSLVVISLSILSQKFANLQVGVPIGDKIGQKGKIPSSTAL